jgi:hypothetical protein
MYYVYRKKDGAIISMSKNPPIVAEDHTMGVIELEKEISRREVGQYRIVQKKLVQDQNIMRRMELARQRREKDQLADAKTFEVSLEQLKSAPADSDAFQHHLVKILELLGPRLFPSLRQKS